MRGGNDTILTIEDLELDDNKLNTLRNSKESILHVLNGVKVYRVKNGKLEKELYTIEIIDTGYKPPPPSIQYFILEQIRTYLLSLKSFKEEEEEEENPLYQRYLPTIVQYMNLFFKDIEKNDERQNIMINVIMPNIRNHFSAYRSSNLLVDNYQEEIKLKDTTSPEFQNKTFEDLKSMVNDTDDLSQLKETFREKERDVPSEIDQVEKMMKNIKSKFVCSVENEQFKINQYEIDINKAQTEINTQIAKILKNTEHMDSVKSLSETLVITEAIIKMLVNNYININIIAYKNGYNTTEKLIIFDKNIYYITLIIESYVLYNVEVFRNKSFNSVLTSKYDVLYQEFIDNKLPNTAEDSFSKDMPRVVLKPITQTSTTPKIGFMSSFFKSETKEKMKDFEFATKFIYLNRSEKKQFLSEKTSKTLEDLRSGKVITKIPDTGTVESTDGDVIERQRILNPKIDSIDSNTTITLTNFGAEISNPKKKSPTEIDKLFYLRKQLHISIFKTTGYHGSTEVTKKVSKECYPLKPSVFRKRVLNYFKSLIVDNENYQLVKTG